MLDDDFDYIKLYIPEGYVAPQYDRSNTPIDWWPKWPRMLAKQYTEPELIRKVFGNRKMANVHGKQSLEAIDKTSSMQSQSMRRAHAANLVAMSGDEYLAIKGAIDIHRLGFIEDTKCSRCPLCKRETIVLTWTDNMIKMCADCARNIDVDTCLSRDYLR